jgi:GTP-binding protein YchF
MEKCLEWVKTSKPLRTCEFTEDEKQAVKALGLMTAKPVLFVANVAEDDLAGKGPLVQQVRDYAAKHGAQVVPICARIEAELAELDEADRGEMLLSVGLTEPGLGPLARAAYRTLGLQSYFTAGEKEVRAWTIPIGATAPQAAGVIHSDFERGFIRCEVYTLEDLETWKSEKEIRAAGKLRVEGKSYVMQDGDICHFLFNV